MLAFRVLLVSLIGIVIAYTGIVVGTQGWDFGSVFFDDILAMKCPGQFNLDFSCLLLLAGLWLAWRHHFSALGVALGLLVLVGARRCCAPTFSSPAFTPRGTRRYCCSERRVRQPESQTSGRAADESPAGP